MGVEVVGFEAVEAPVGTIPEGDNSVKGNGKLDEGSGPNEPIKFGSHGDESVKNHGNEVSVPDFPKDAADEWPAPKQIHSFYFVRHRRYEDPKIVAKIEQAQKEVYNNKVPSESSITDALRAKRKEKDELIGQIKDLKNESAEISKNLEMYSEDIKELQEDLRKLHSTEFSSEAELDSRIQSLEYIIQHESIPLSEEKKKLKEIKSLQSTRKQVKEKADKLARLDEMVPKETRQNQDKLKRERYGIWSRIRSLEDALIPIKNEILSLKQEENIVYEKSKKSRDSVHQLRIQKHEGNTDYFQSRKILDGARGLAAGNDVKALEELSHAEVEKFMSLWNSSKGFRDDYEKKILPSLDSRQLSRDGRIRNPDEKPLMVVEASRARELETASKANAKQAREDTKSAPSDTLPVQKEAKNGAIFAKSTEEHIDADKEVFGTEKHTEESIPKDNKVDAAKLKEMKRLEEIEKNKQALERKKKKAEKDAAKAALRAQKEAEKKLKELEKKAKKKASSASETNPEEPTEPVAVAAEPEKVSENAEVPVPAKAKVQKDNNLRSRGRARGPDSLPKAILKRKKSSMNYWLWAVPATLLVVLFLALGYYYLL